MRNLDRRIDIERKAITRGDMGGVIETWSKIATRRPAAVRPVKGDERFVGEQFIANQQIEFIIRYSSSVADVNPLDRIVYPSSADADSPALDPQIFDILSVTELGRRDGLSIIAQRRAENA